MSGQRIGYVRVSTADKSTARQLAGLELAKVFEDKASGKDANRPQLKAALEYVREGDTLFVHSLDRLARSLFDLQRILNQLAAKGVAVEFVKERLSFTGTDEPFQKLQLQMLGAFAEFERSMIRERQREGIDAAKAAGRHCGRPSKLTGAQLVAIRERKAQGEDMTALAADHGVSRQTLYKALAREKDQALIQPAQSIRLLGLANLKR